MLMPVVFILCTHREEQGKGNTVTHLSSFAVLSNCHRSTASLFSTLEMTTATCCTTHSYSPSERRHSCARKTSARRCARAPRGPRLPPPRPRAPVVGDPRDQLRVRAAAAEQPGPAVPRSLLGPQREAWLLGAGPAAARWKYQRLSPLNFAAAPAAVAAGRGKRSPCRGNAVGSSVLGLV